MSKRRKRKRKPQARRTGWLISPKQVQTWLSKVEEQIIEGNYEGAVRTARRVLRYVPEGSAPYGKAHYYLGMASLMLQDFDAGYDALSTALEVEPEDSETWYNRGIVCRYVMRSGQSVRDLERAVALASHPGVREKYEEELAFSRKLVQHELALRGPDFVLEQLIEQQETYQRALKLAEASRWAEAEAYFRQVIKMGDCLPQPWGNLAGSLIMQERYDEAKAALRRALEIDPDYEIARRNLEMLPDIRRSGPPDMEIKSPFDGHDIKRTLTFIKD